MGSNMIRGCVEQQNWVTCLENKLLIKVTYKITNIN